MFETRALLVVTFACALACSSEDGSDGGVQYEKPQIVPASGNPVCLSMRRVEVGETVNQPLILRNDGRQTLMISTVTIQGDVRNHFTFQGPDVMTVESFDNALVQLRYAPTAPGWDAVRLEVTSNAENYPVLAVFILARAEPQGLDGGIADAGDKPMEAAMACPQ